MSSDQNHHNNNNKVWIMSGDPQEGYLMSGRLMLTSILILFAAVILMIALHFLAKRYITRLRRRQYDRRRHRLVSRSQVLMYIDTLSGGHRGGLDRQVLNSLPLYFYTPKQTTTPTTTDPPECSICLSEFEFRDVVRMLPKCSHCFHIECIDTWFRSRTTCPICRSSVEMAAGKVEEGGGGLSEDEEIRRMELVEVRVEMPPLRAAAVENEMSLTRIPTVEGLAPAPAPSTVNV